MQAPDDKQVLDYIASVPGLREQWGIPGAKRLGTIMFVLMSLFLIAIAIGAIAYFMLVDPRISGKEISGLIIVLVLAYAVAVVRVLQLRTERKELAKYRSALARALTGNPSTDTQTQTEVATSFKWEAKRYIIIARMIGIAALVIIGINTYQVGSTDFARVLLFDGAILSYLTGALWANYAFKADVLETELEERSRATMRWQQEHPGEAQKMLEDEETGSEDDPSFDE